MIKETDYHGWKASRIETGKAELIIPHDIGPRILHCGLKGAGNLFHNIEAHMGGCDESEWMARGGHRLWHAPEHEERTYALDNKPVEVSFLKNDSGLQLKQASEEATGLQKSMLIEVVGATTFRVTHSICNEGNLWAVECAPWALTVLERGGYGVIPLPAKGEHPRDLLPEYSLIPWSYTDFSLPCWEMHKDFIGIRTDKVESSQKVGVTSYPGWSMYWQEAGTFVKYASVDATKTYPDRGSVFESYCCDFMIEMETLGPLIRLNPGETMEHVEYWGLFDALPKPDTQGAYTRDILPHITQWLQSII